MNPRNEQRQSVRCAVADMRRRSTFITAGGESPAMLLDESAGGFAIALAQAPDVNIGDRAALQTDSGLYEVRVANIRETKLLDDDLTVSNPSRVWFRLGLVRLGEVPPEEPRPSFAVAHLPAGAQQASGAGLWIFSGLFLTAIAVAAAAWFIFAGRHVKPIEEQPTFSRSEKPWSMPELRESPKAEKFGGQSFIPPLEFGADDSRFEPAQWLPGFERQKLPAKSVENTSEAVLAAVRRLPGATAMVLSDVAQELKLTDEQRRQIQQLVDEVIEAIRALDPQAAMEQLSREEIVRRREELHAVARQKALKLLTPEQRARWEKLLGVDSEQAKGGK